MLESTRSPGDEATTTTGGGTSADPARDKSGQKKYSTLNGRYAILAAIGRGGMATVYRAKDTMLGRDVAIKLFNASAGDEAIPRRDAELKVLASLNHHGIVTLLDAGVHVDGKGIPHHYLVMELVEGTDLQRRLAGEELTSRQIGEIGYDIAEALEYVHARGVVHRDIKPSNILVVDYRDNAQRTRAQLTDFGIARTEEDPRLTMEGQTTGTAGYLSPEQAASEGVGSATDVYSLGLVLLECFTRKMAYPGAQVQSAIARLLKQPEVPDSIPADWAALLTAMTSRNPAARPELHELVQAIRQLIIDESGRHKDVDPTIIPANEAERMDAVRRYDVLDTPPDGTFDRITALAARTLKVPIAIVSVVDSDRIWFKSRHGIEVAEIGRDAGLCASAILSDDAWVIKNARIDPRTLTNPLVASEFGLQFYAGVPLRTRDGFNLGTLCVLDFEPREITADDQQTLTDLAALVMSELELRLESRRATESAAAAVDAAAVVVDTAVALVDTASGTLRTSPPLQTNSTVYTTPSAGERTSADAELPANQQATGSAAFPLEPR